MAIMMLALQPGVTFGADPAPAGGRALFVVVAVIAVLAGAAWVLKRKMPQGRSGQAVTVETAVSLGERRSLVIVSVEGRRLLLGLTPTQIALVSELGASFPQTLHASLQTDPQS